MTVKGVQPLGLHTCAACVQGKPENRASTLLAQAVPALGIPSRAGFQSPSLSVILVGCMTLGPAWLMLTGWTYPQLPLLMEGPWGCPHSREVIL